MRLDKWLKEAGVCKSTSEARRLIKQGGISFNKEKVCPDTLYVYFGGGKYVLSSIDIESLDEYKEFIKNKPSNRKDE